MRKPVDTLYLNVWQLGNDRFGHGGFRDAGKFQESLRLELGDPQGLNVSPDPPKYRV
jgi:hypothetical protein